jgi:Flp pilus assembly protein TadB
VITCEEVFELKIPLPDVVAMQTRQPNLEGTGEIQLRRLVKEALRMRPDRIIVGEVRQEECLDLLIALNSGLPGMCSIHANSAREAIVKMCTLPLLAGENVGHGFVVPTVASCIDIVVHTGKDGSGHRRVREIVAVPAGWRATSSRWPTCSSPAGSGWCGPTATRRTRSATSGPASTWPSCWPTTAGASRGTAPRAAVRARLPARLALGPRRAPAATRQGAGLTERTKDLLVQAGIEGVTPNQLFSASAVLGVVVFVVVLGTSQVPVLGALFGGFAALLPLLLVRRRRSQRRVELREVWPEAVDNLASGVRAGLSLPEALSQLGVRGPEQLRSAFNRFGQDYRATGRFGESLDTLKTNLSDPVGDRVVEALRMAREVGGTDLGRLLRTLSTFLREDARTRSELETRQGLDGQRSPAGALCAPGCCCPAVEPAGGRAPPTTPAPAPWCCWPAGWSRCWPTASCCGSPGCRPEGPGAAVSLLAGSLVGAAVGGGLLLAVTGLPIARQADAGGPARAVPARHPAAVDGC